MNLAISSETRGKSIASFVRAARAGDMECVRQELITGHLAPDVQEEVDKLIKRIDIKFDSFFFYKYCTFCRLLTRWLYRGTLLWFSMEGKLLFWFYCRLQLTRYRFGKEALNLIKSKFWGHIHRYHWKSLATKIISAKYKCSIINDSDFTTEVKVSKYDVELVTKTTY